MLQNLDYLRMWYYTCEMYFFLLIIVLIGHDQKGKLKDFQSTLELFFMAF
jgi:hypothetical protein